MLLGYALIIIATISIISFLSIKKTDDSLKSSASKMTNEITSQIRLTIDNYLATVETTSTLAFSSKDLYKYDAEHTTMDEYDALNLEKEISNKLYELCITDNYVDFCIVYSNNHSVGKLSNGTLNLFEDRIYEDMRAMITNPKTNDGWACGYKDDYKRIYYVKEINENAVLVASFYTTELENVFEHHLEDMNVYLTNDNYIVMYSSDDSELGKELPEDIKKRIEGNYSITRMDDDYLISVDRCNLNWYTICTTETENILKEKNTITVYIIMVGFIAAVISLAIVYLITNQVSKPMNYMVSRLDSEAKSDKLTGLYNKISYEEEVKNELANNPDLQYALFLFDLDNFKGVNDNYGHIVGDQVLSGISTIIKKQFRESDIIGRIGGDEFSAFIKLGDRDNNFDNILTTKCLALCQAFQSVYIDKSKKKKMSVSIGVALVSDSDGTFETLYKNADKALYESKHAGKNTYTIYNEEYEQ